MQSQFFKDFLLNQSSIAAASRQRVIQTIRMNNADLNETKKYFTIKTNPGQNTTQLIDIRILFLLFLLRFSLVKLPVQINKLRMHQSNASGQAQQTSQ